MSEQQMPEARIWATSTQLPGTDKQRKSYFMTITDGESQLQVILQVGPDTLLVAEPYVTHEYDYTQYDEWGYEDEDYRDDEYALWEDEAYEAEEEEMESDVSSNQA